MTNDDYADMAELLKPFLASKDLEHLFIGGISGLKAQNSIATLTGLRLSNLHTLTLHSHWSFSAYQVDLARLVDVLENLRGIHIPHGSLGPVVFDALSRRQNLSSIEFAEGYQWNRVVEEWDFVLNEDSFPCLSTLCTEASADSLRRCLISCPSVVQRLKHLQVETLIRENPTVIHRLISILSQLCYNLTVLKIDFRHVGPYIGHPLLRFHRDEKDAEPVTFDTIEPLLQLRNMRSFEILDRRPIALTEEQVCIMASSWPDIEVLGLSPQPVLDLDCVLSFSALIPFLYQCCRLERLSTCIDPRRSVSSRSIPGWPLEEQLRCHEMGHSLLSEIPAKPDHICNFSFSLVVPVHGQNSVFITNLRRIKRNSAMECEISRTTMELQG